MASARDCWTRLSDSFWYFAYPGSCLSVTTRIDSTFDLGATPMIPLPPPAWPWPAMSEAIQVPWVPQYGSDGEVLTPVRSGPVSTEPARSDTLGLTPLSITATVTPCPSVTDQAVGAPSSSRTHIWALRTSSAAAGPAVTAAKPDSTLVASTPAADRSSQRGRLKRDGSVADLEVCPGSSRCDRVRRGRGISMPDRPGSAAAAGARQFPTRPSARSRPPRSASRP